PAHANLAALTRRQRGARHDVDDLRFHVRERQANGAAPNSRGILRRRVTGQVRLGHPVALGDQALETVGAGALDILVERSRPGPDQLDRREIELVDERMPGQSEHDRRHQVEMRQPIFLDEPEKLRQIEPGHGDAEAAQVEREVHEHRLAVDVEEGQDAERAPGLVDLRLRLDLAGHGHEVAMREHHTLRPAGGATRVWKHREVVRCIDADRRRIAVIVEERGKTCRAAVLGRRVAEHEDPAHRRAARGLARFVEEQRDRDQILRAGVAELEAELLGRIQRIGRRHDAADHERAVERQRILGQVRAADGHDVALGEATACETGRHPPRAPGDLSLRERSPAGAVDEDGPLGAIEEIGANARQRWGVREGDRVAVRSGYGCGRCEACSRWEPRLCRKRGGTYGYTDVNKPPQLWGGYAELMYLSPYTVLKKMDPKIPAGVAVMFNPLAAGLSWAASVPGTGPGDRVVVLGAGQR